MPISTAVRTARGKVRPRHEDAFGLFPELQTYVVADGMGGGEGGILASTLAVETIRHTPRHRVEGRDQPAARQ
jgi:serine/threonine-protein phosphatase Stp1